ncbi:MAG: hypothetical protein WAN22_30055, partial [Solirubrobacteraceae bacterium]
GLRVRHADGRSFLASQGRGGWDAVVIDAFVGAVVPRALITVEALAGVARVAPLVLVNVLDNRTAREVRTVGAALTLAYPRVWGLGARAGNTILVGAAVELDLDRIAAAAAADPSPTRIMRPDAMALLIGGTPPLRDAEVGGAEIGGA